MKLWVVYNTAVKKIGNVSPLVVTAVLTISFNVFALTWLSHSDLIFSLILIIETSRAHSMQRSASCYFIFFTGKDETKCKKARKTLKLFFKTKQSLFWLTLIIFWRINNQIISQTTDSESHWPKLTVYVYGKQFTAPRFGPRVENHLFQ